MRLKKYQASTGLEHWLDTDYDRCYFQASFCTGFPSTTAIEMSMSVVQCIISTYFQKTLVWQRWCLQVIKFCDRITRKQKNSKTKIFSVGTIISS